MLLLYTGDSDLATVESFQALLPWQSGAAFIGGCFYTYTFQETLHHGLEALYSFGKRIPKQVWNVQLDPPKHLLVVATNH